LVRAFGWGAVLPLVSIVMALIVHPLAILLWPGLNLIQIARRAGRIGVRHATLAAIAHFAALAGVLRYAWRAARGDAGGTLVYK
jgi:hypothetical protein